LKKELLKKFQNVLRQLALQKLQKKNRSVEVAEASETQEEDSSDEVEEALENIEVEDAAVVNNNESSSEGDSLRERFAKTFKESVKISY
jgi:hypothetical protein